LPRCGGNTNDRVAPVVLPVLNPTALHPVLDSLSGNAEMPSRGGNRHPFPVVIASNHVAPIRCRQHAALLRGQLQLCMMTLPE
jgi:hypothetical protein